ncbi:2596_t:CDS:2, partial [Gigaspora rosea]
MNFSIHIDDNNIIRLPFGRAVEQYLYSLPISCGTRYKVQSRKRVNDAVKLGFITVERVEGSVDYLCWKTEKGQNKSTNRLDDSLRLTESGKHRVQQILAGEKIDLQVWHWVWFCSGKDMHKCSIRIITKVMLFEVDTEYPARLIIESNHVPQNVIQEITIPSRINLSREARDLVITSRRADKRTIKEIKMKLLLPYNGVSQHELKKPIYQVGPWTTVHELVNSVLKQKGVVLYYQQADINASEDSSNRYYQLTLSDDLWLEQARDCGSFCFGIDGKYDLNTDRAPVLSLVVEDNAGYETPIAFGISNKENNHTIRLTVEAVQRNIPCNNADLWRPFAMIDKHQPTKRELQHILRGVILCWFHIMQTLGEHLKNLRIDNHYRYPIAIAFKIVGRSRDKEEALKLGKAYQSFIKSLPLTENAKESLCNDIFANWLSEEWINSFIDGGIQPINCFIEKLYGITLVRSNIIKEASSQLIFEAGQVTYWNSRIIEHQTLLFKQPMDIKRRLNQGRLYVLLNLVKPADRKLDMYFYVKKVNNKFRLLYTMRDICINGEIYQLFQPMLNILASKHPVAQEDNYYLVNISTENNKIAPDVIKHDLVLHFHNNECAIPNELKNNIIYSNSDDAAFEEILRIYSEQGNDIFFLYEHGVTEKDPFCPAEMPAKKISSIGASKIHGAKLRKINSFAPITDKE